MLAFSFYHNIAFPCVGTPSPPSPTEYRTFLCSSLDSQFLSLEPDRLCGHPAEVCWVTGYAKNKRMEKARKRGKAKKGCNTDTRIFFLLLYYKRLPKIQLLIHEPYIWSFIGGKHRMMICVGKYPSRAYLVFTPHSEDRRPSETRCWMYSGFFGCLCVCVLSIDTWIARNPNHPLSSQGRAWVRGSLEKGRAQRGRTQSCLWPLKAPALGLPPSHKARKPWTSH